MAFHGGFHEDRRLYGSRKRRGENLSGECKRRKTLSIEQPPYEELAPLVQQYLRQGDCPSMVGLLCSLTVWSRRRLFQIQDLKLALHQAYTVKCFELLRYIVELRVVHIDEVNSDGLTVLYRAVWDNNADVVRFLLQHGAQVGKADENLHQRSCAFPPILGLALEKCDVDIIKMLLTAGATIDRDDLYIPHTNYHDFSEITNCMLEHGLTRNTKLCNAFLCLALYWGQSRVINKLWHHRQQTVRALVCYTIHVIIARRIQNEHVEMLAEISPIHHRINIYEIVGARFILEHDVSAGLYWWNRARDLRLRHSVKTGLRVLPAGSSDGEDVWELETLESNLSSLRPKAFLIIERVWLELHTEFTEAGRAEPRTVRRRGTSILHRGLELGMDFFRRPSTDTAVMFALTKSVESAGTEEKKAAVVRWALRVLRFIMEGMNKPFQKQTKSGKNHHDVTVTLPEERCELCGKLSDLEDSFLRSVDLLLPLLPSARPSDTEDLEGLVREFIRDDPCLRGRTRLHKACAKFSSHPALLKLLVQCSAELSSRLRVGCASHLRPDRDGRTPLHVLAGKISQEHLIDENVLGTFVDHGAHLCSQDSFGQSVLDVLTSRDVHVDGFVPLPLQCVMARVVREKVPKADWQEDLYKEILLRH